MKLYVREPGTGWMIGLANPSNGHTLAILGLARVEFRAAVRQRERIGDVTHAVAQELLNAMERHLHEVYLVQPVTEAVIEEAARLLDRHPLRAYDAMQLAGCLSLQARLPEALAFVCADRRLSEAAEREGVTALDPVSQEGPEEQ